VNQPGLFTAPHNGTRTSIAAARRIQSSLADQERRVLDVLSTSPQGLTRQELADVSSLRLASVCGRANSLIGKGLVVERGTRRNVNGGPAAVLFVNKETMQ
jgi:DNA-binding IclR family transcriptional regulator